MKSEIIMTTESNQNHLQGASNTSSNESLIHNHKSSIDRYKALQGIQNTKQRDFITQGYNNQYRRI